MWAIIPWLNNADMTMQAAADFLRQEGVGEARVLLINNGASWEEREKVSRFAELHGDACLVWNHEPALLSLAATWNAGLNFCWEQGETEACVLNNDVRCTVDTASSLRRIMRETKALLVTATGVEEEETLFKEAEDHGQLTLAWDAVKNCWSRGGPGFSFFMMSKEGHEKYPFDEALTPAFCEDCDLHRRMMLGGDGERIFGTNVRYLHLGGQTLKGMSPERRAMVERAISSGSRAHYARKWNGGVNEETEIEPFFKTDPPNEGEWNVPEWIVKRWKLGESVTTPALFEEIRRGW